MVRLIILLAFIIGGASASASIMEKMNKRPSFAKLARAKADAQHEVVIAVHQKNLPLLEAELLERSTPGTPKYQKWMSFEEVGTMIDTLESAVKIKSWLVESKIEVTWTSLRADYIKATAPISVWEKLLETEFFEWEEHGNFKGTVVRSEQYSLPETIIPFIFAVFNTCQAMPFITHGALRKEDSPYKTDMTIKHRKFNEKTDSTSQKVDSTSQKIDSSSTVNPVTISFLNSHYGIPAGTKGSSTLSQAVFETNGESMSPSDLTTFQTTYGLSVAAATNVGGFTTSNCTTTGVGTDCYEGNLDIQYISGLAQNTVSIYWYVASTLSAPDPFITFLTNVANAPEGVGRPTVLSISWGSIEQYNSASYMAAFNTEAIKCGSEGITIVVSSGDDGAVGQGGRPSHCNWMYPNSPGNCACDADSSSNTVSWATSTWSGTGYFPSYPATSPYVTAVGATQGPNAGTAEIAAQSQLGGSITTGGGFSTYFQQPSYQQTQAKNYLANHTGNIWSGFNPQGRAYPDVALIGVNYQVVVQGTIVGLYGTSASAPAFAAMVSLVNAQRQTAGKVTVGFINPSLYASSNTNKYIDITSGSSYCPAGSSSPCCYYPGFYAVAGWDPLTGLGAITYPNLKLVLGV